MNMMDFQVVVLGSGVSKKLLPLVSKVLQLRQGTASGGLTIKELNDLLDQLSSSENRFYSKYASAYAVEVQKGPSLRASLFFKGNGEADAEIMDGEIEAEEENGVIKGPELFAKAEDFIGNFYRQLKMQR